MRSDERGQKLASALIKPVLAHADQTGQHIILETHKPDNIALYQHLGFQIVHQQTYPATAPMTTTMVRDPDQP